MMCINIHTLFNCLHFEIIDRRGEHANGHICTRWRSLMSSTTSVLHVASLLSVIVTNGATHILILILSRGGGGANGDKNKVGRMLDATRSDTSHLFLRS